MVEQREVQTIIRIPASNSAVLRLKRVYRSVATFARRYPLGAVAGSILLAIIIVAVAAPLVAPDDPIHIDITAFRQHPSSSHVMGTDYQGRDILSRVVYGSRVSLSVALLVVVMGTTTGAIWGLASGYVGGKFDLIGQRVMEVMMSFPNIILAMILVAGMGGGFWVIVIAISVTQVPLSLRVIRAVGLSVKESDYVLAARALGASSLRIMSLHIAPQCIAPYLILATANLGVAIIAEASLSFIGAGVNPPTATWGNMLGGAVAVVLTPHWPLVVFPGIAITLTVLCFNLFGDAIRDSLDPKLRGR